MLLTHQTVFQSEMLTIRHARARPSGMPLSELEHARADLLLLPVSGVFALHERPTQHFIANANHALLLALGQPYRISFPGDIGDDCLVLGFSSQHLAGLLAEAAGVDKLRSPALDLHCLLTPQSMLQRDLLLRLLAMDRPDPLAVEEISVSLLAAATRAACKNNRRPEDGRQALTMTRRKRQAETVKELISLYPEQEWSLDSLARAASISPYHLSRLFREEVGLPVHQYLVRTRLGKALQGMRTPMRDLTAIAVDAGFAHHSHFTASFRALFGMTPSQFRNCARS